MRFEENGYARIGIMPRYGDANSIKWFEVEPCCVFHIINCFEDNDEVLKYFYLDSRCFTKSNFYTFNMIFNTIRSLESSYLHVTTHKSKISNLKNMSFNFVHDVKL